MVIDDLYNKAMSAGATGAKLLGAGGGGFLLVFAAPKHQAAIKQILADYLHVPFSFESSGSQLLFNSYQSS